MLHARHFCAAGVLASALCSTTLMAQATDTPKPEWAIVTTTQIKPEFRQEYESAAKEISAAYKKVNAPYRIVVQTMLGDINEYTSVTPLAKFADMDGPTVLVRALGDAKAQQLLHRVGGYANSIHRVTTLAMNDISIRTEVEDPGQYAQLTIYRLFPGKARAFSTYIHDDYLPAMRKADVANLWFSRPIFGGDLDERIMIRPMHKLAEIDAGPLTRKALGAEGAQQLAARGADIIQSTHYSIVRLRLDLSHMPAPQAKSKSGE